MLNSIKTRFKTRFSALPIHQRLYLIAALILIAGAIAAALIIYFTPAPDMRYLADGADFPVSQDNSRQYQFQIERIGGKEGLLAAQLNEWFASLWQGRQLGYTIFCIAAAIALVCCGLGKLFSLQVRDKR